MRNVTPQRLLVIVVASIVGFVVTTELVERFGGPAGRHR